MKVAPGQTWKKTIGRPYQRTSSLRMADKSNDNQKILVAFDFDHTVIDDNSDIYISKLCPNGNIPQEIKDKYSDRGWTDYMGAIFEYLHINGITEADLKNNIEELPLTDGMGELLKYLGSENFEVIIVSDSNSMFISYSLNKFKLVDTVNAVYTNPASYDQNGCLRIEWFHHQDWCDLSTENLCKGQILEDHIAKRKLENVVYDYIVYVGDGYNDLCPALRLREKDFICPRKDFHLWKKFKKLGLLNGETSDYDLKAKILEWDSGLQVLDLIKELERQSQDGSLKVKL